MFGGILIEKLLLENQGQMIDGNDSLKVFDVYQESMTWTGNTIFNVPRITSSRCLLQVCLCVEFKDLWDVHRCSELDFDIKSWMDKMTDENSMFHYWKMILDFQYLILQFFNVKREETLKLYLQVLHGALKCMFDL